MKKQTIFAKILRVVTVPALIAMAFGLVLAMPVSAADDKPAYRLQISPTQDNIGKLQPGETYHGTFNVQNTGRNAYAYTVEVSPFSVEGREYTQKFDQSTKYTVVTDWVSFDRTRGTVEPNDQQPVNYTITVPSDAPGGLQSAAIMVTMVNTEEMKASGIQTVSRAAFPVYMNIDGETNRNAKIVENKIPVILFNPPLVVSSVVENNGNIYTNASYRLEVRNFFGGKLVYTNAEDDKDGVEQIDMQVIFPETQRYNEVVWKDAPQFGLFKVKQVVNIFEETSEKEKVVLIVPLWFVIIVLLFLAICIYKIVNTILRSRDAKKSA